MNLRVVLISYKQNLNLIFISTENILKDLKFKEEEEAFLETLRVKEEEEQKKNDDEKAIFDARASVIARRKQKADR